MDKVAIEKSESGGVLKIDGIEVAELSSTEMLSLAGTLRDFVLENADDFDNVPTKTVRINGKEFKVAVSDRLPFWESLERIEWEPETFSIFDKFLRPDSVFLDVGGWIGSTALYGAQLASQTYVFEPDPIAFEELELNAHLNRKSSWHKRLQLLNAGISSDDQGIQLGIHGDGGDSMSSVLLGEEGASWPVQSMEINDFISAHNLSASRLFCKIDIEGFEYALAGSIGKIFESCPNAHLYLSLHPQFLVREINKSKSGFLTKRMDFYRQHKSLFEPFKNHRMVHVNDKPFDLEKELRKALVTMDFPKGVVIFPK